MELLPKQNTGAKVRRWGIAAAVLLFAGGTALGLGLPAVLDIPKLKDRSPGDPPDSAVFSHWQHESYTCSSCHPSVFPQYKQGFTHADMETGRYCGSCHNGKTAFGPKDKGVQCETCHVPSSAPAIDEGELWD